MRKLLILSVVLCAIIVCGAAAAYADDAYVMAVVNGKTSDRVNLREGPSTSYDSMGLFFTGTQVYCESDINAEWVKVTIGRLAGWMKTEYLYFGDPKDIKPLQPYVTTHYTDGPYILEEPFMSQQIYIPKNDQKYVVLGETKDYFYYVYHIGIGQYGYLHKDHDYPSGVAGIYLPAQTHNETAGYEYEMRTDVRNDDFCTISVQNPYFANVNLTWLNKILTNQAVGFLQAGINEHGLYYPITIDYKCEVTLASEDIISVVFFGNYSAEGMPHPIAKLLPYNYDVKSRAELLLADMYSIDDGFVRVLMEKSFYPTDSITSWDEDRFNEQLATYNQTSIRDSACFYLKPDGVVISLPANHESGCDHFEAQLWYDDAAQFYKREQ